MSLHKERKKVHEELIREAFVLSKEMTEDMPGYSKKSGTYTEISSLPDKKKRSVELQSRDMIKKYEYQVSSLLNQCDTAPDIYLNGKFKRLIQNISSHFAHSYHRISEYGESEHYFLIALLHERDIEKRAVLYRSLIEMQMEEHRNQPQQAPMYITSIAQMLQEAWDRYRRTNGDQVLLHTFEQLPLRTQDKIAVLEKMHPSTKDEAHHHILIGYLSVICKDLENARKHVQQAILVSKRSEVLPYFLELLSQTVQYIDSKLR